MKSIFICGFFGLVMAWSALVVRGAELKFVPGHVPPAAARLAPLGRLEADRRLQLSIGLPLRNQAALEEFLQRLYDPTSPDYHRFLTTTEFTEKFGPTPEQYEAVKAFATTNGLDIVGTYSNRVVLDVEAPVAAIEKALHTVLRTYQHPVESRAFFAPDTEPSVDANLPILHVAGLDNYQLPHPACRLSTIQASAGDSPALGSGYGGSYLGNDFRAAYVPGVPLNGAGQTIGLLEINAGFSQSDITAYESLAGDPAVPVTTVLLGYGGGLGSANGEVSLDIEMAIAMAPGLNGVIAYEGSSADSILNRMASDNLSRQLSASWTYGTDATSQQDFMEFAAQGQSFFNASGDGDAWVGTIDSPSDNTNITIVGGTVLYASSPGGAWRGESVWNSGYTPPAWSGGGNGYWGSGGGISTIYSIPVWQQGISMTANEGSTSLRNIPDVAMTGQNAYVTYSNGLAGVFEGTSCATPLWAGFTALINQQAAANGNAAVGFLNPALYAIGKSASYANCFHDIVSGNNTNGQSPTLFYAVPGYDLCTGWGTPAGEPLIDALAPDALGVGVPTGLSASGPVGGPFTNSSVTILLTNRGAASLRWACVNSLPWLIVQPTNGTLAAAQSATVALNLMASTTNLPEGQYSGVIWFTNLSDGIGQQRQNLLVVNPRSVPTYGAAVQYLQPSAYWPLNETAAPLAANVASNAGTLGLWANGFPFEGVLQGQTGIVGNCAYFRNPNLIVAAAGPHIDVSFNPRLNPAGPFTVEFWAKPGQSPNDFFCPLSSIDDTEYSGASREGWVFYETSANQWTFRLGGTNGYVAISSGGIVQTQVWQNVAGRYDGTNATLYVNGAAVSGPIAAARYFPNTNALFTLRIGGTSFGNRTFDGWVDEVAVYTNALSAATLQAHYQAATNNKINYGTQILASNPAGYWRLDEPAYTAVSPSSLPVAVNSGSLSSAANGIYFPGTTPGVPGVFGVGFGSSNNACAFSANSYVDVPGPPLSFTAAMTLSAWVNCAVTPDLTESVASLGAGSYALTIDAQGYPHFVDGAQTFGALAGASPITDGRWHNLVGVYDGKNAEYLYVDGLPAASAVTATNLPVVTGNDFWIGGNPDTGVFQYFYGLIDEVALWPEALTPSDILWLYAAGKNVPLLSGRTSPSEQGTISLSWSTVPGIAYGVEFTTNLNSPDWLQLGSTFTATNAISTVSESLVGSQLYFRLLVQP